MEVLNEIVIKIEGEIHSCSQGVNKLMDFYVEACKHKNTSIYVDFTGLDWIDANLSALLEALLFRLETENNLKITTDFDLIFEKFNVLFRNGSMQVEDFIVHDNEKTTIPFMKFSPHETNEFYEYINGKLMVNAGMHQISNELKEQIKDDLYEIFQNIFKHARTTYPCFICGQFYPAKREFKLTIVDLGVGFLTPIKERTNGHISRDKDAIEWAISGKSSKVLDSSKEIGGLALSGISEYLIANNGIFQIYSGNDFWGTDLKNGIFDGCRTLKNYFAGSMLTLIFNSKV